MKKLVNVLMYSSALLPMIIIVILIEVRLYIEELVIAFSSNYEMMIHDFVNQHLTTALSFSLVALVIWLLFHRLLRRTRAAAKKMATLSKVHNRTFGHYFEYSFY